MFCKKFLLMMAILFFGAIEAQVTIGSEFQPNKGAILDLKEREGTGVNSTKGILMPRVALEKKNELTPVVSEVDSSIQKMNHTGLMLYNVNTVEQEGLCPGLYTWNSMEWIRLSGACEEDRNDLTLSLTTINLDVDGFDKLNANQGIVSLTYTASRAVTVTSSAPWIGLNHLTATKTLTVDVEPSNEEARTGTITISDGIDTKIVTVNQEGLIFSASADPVGIVANGGSVLLTILKNSSRRDLVSNSNSTWATLTSPTSLSTNVSIAKNTATSSRIAEFTTTLGTLRSTYGKENLGLSTSKKTALTQEGAVAVIPKAGRWEYSDNQTGVVLVLDDSRMIKIPGSYSNVKIRCVNAVEEDFPLTFLQVQVAPPGSAVYSGIKVTSDPSLGDTVEFASIGGRASGNISLLFENKKKNKIYVFGIFFK